MPRSGATLTEVLISLAVMSIGLVSVATMFPISVVRSLMASQLTKGTDLRYNTESMIDLYPTMITNPGLLAPATPLTTEFFVIDPLQVATLPAASPYRGTFGNVYSYTNGAQQVLTQTFAAGGQVNTGGGVNRYNFVPANAIAPDYLVTFPDTWVPVYEGDAVGGVAVGGATGYTQIQVTGLTGGGATFPPPGATYRIVIFGADGKTSHVRRITGVPASGLPTVTWSEDIANFGTLDPGEDLNNNGVLDTYPIPGTGASPTFVPFKARVEVQERRYTWLLTVRRLNGVASVDAVIFFGRSLENPVEDEALYPSNLVAGAKSFTVDYTKFSQAPQAKRGYCFDVNNARWYRITSAIDNPNNTSSSKQMTVGIEVQAFASQPNPGYVLFPKGVVDVYPLGNKP